MMFTWRCTLASFLAVLIAAPLLLPLFELVRQGLGAWTASDLTRVLTLYGRTAYLVAGVLLIVLPAGLIAALFAFRASWPGRRQFLLFLGFLLFVPLPIHAIAWQTLLGSDGLLALWGPNVAAGRPWAYGLGPAIWVHAMAALPWVIFLLGFAASMVERELEEELLLARPPLWVVAYIIVPRCRSALLLAAVWVAFQTGGEIAVTDMFQVATLAEEVHTQFTLGDDEGLVRTIVAVLPLILLSWLLVGWLAPRLEMFVRPMHHLWIDARPLPFSGWVRHGGAAGALLAAAVLAAPSVGIVWKLGQAGHPPTWNADTATTFLMSEARLHAGVTTANVALAAVTGMLVSVAAWIACWLAQGSAPLRHWLFFIAALALALPGPVIGIGLKTVIAALVDWFPGGLLERALYRAPSPLPLLWAWSIRAFPFALLLLWPVVRRTPWEGVDALRLETSSRWREFWIAIVPWTWRAAVVAALASTALALTEVAASTRVDTPGWESYAKLLFDRMHYGVENSVAALALLMLVLVAALVAAAAALILLKRSGRHHHEVGRNIT